MLTEWAWIAAKLVTAPETKIKVVDYGYRPFGKYAEARRNLLEHLEDEKSCQDFQDAARLLRANRKATSVVYSPLIWLIHDLPQGDDSKRASYQLIKRLEPSLIEQLLPGLATSQVSQHARLGVALRVLSVEEVCVLMRCKPQKARAHTEIWLSGRLKMRTQHVARGAVCRSHRDAACTACRGGAQWEWAEPFLASDLVQHLLSYRMRCYLPYDRTPVPPGTYEAGL
ncbi:hypothetical protein ACFVTF_04585 [Kitasatospora sp. NPDC057940]|uniref:hypothetical protein n=1 Tax=Kitasatospora sp. NPDC057940 TaxID=3346285 RepID=UPI0036DE54E6